jgi:cytochrome c556
VIKPMHRYLSFSLAGLLMLSAQLQAQVRPETAISYRKSAYTVIIWNWQPMSAMMRGTVPFDKARFEKGANRVAMMATQLLEGFPVGSDKGAPTEALPAIWTNWTDFQQKMKSFESEAAALAAVSKTGNVAKIKAQFAKVGASCGACHDLYKAE